LKLEVDEILLGFVVGQVQFLNVVCAVLEGAVLLFDVRFEMVGNGVERDICDWDFVGEGCWC